MIKSMMKIALGIMIANLLFSVAYAQPISLTENQMDSVAAGGVYKVDAFVCPVIISTAVGENNPKAVELGSSGTYTIGPSTGASGGEIWVPIHATNADGMGIPGMTSGPNQQSQPGDTNYTAIWYDISHTHP